MCIFVCNFLFGHCWVKKQFIEKIIAPVLMMGELRNSELQLIKRSQENRRTQTDYGVAGNIGGKGCELRNYGMCPGYPTVLAVTVATTIYLANLPLKVNNENKRKFRRRDPLTRQSGSPMMGSQENRRDQEPYFL